MIQCRAHEVEDKARVVIDQVGVGVFEAARAARCDARLLACDVGLAEQTRWLGEEATDHPVQERAEKQREARAAKAVLDAREETHLAHGRGIGADEPVARAAQLDDQAELSALQVLDATPDQVGRLLAREACEVAAIDQRNADAASGKSSCTDCAIDSAADDQNVEGGVFKFVEIALPEFHGIRRQRPCSLIVP